MSHYKEPASLDELEFHVFECDRSDCTAVVSDSGTFSEVWKAAKEDGWRCWKEGNGTYVHICPDCARKETDSCR